MPTNTSKFNLVKPLKSEKYNVDVFNGNADIIDSQIYSKTEVDTALNGKANSVHTHVKADITDFSHTHPISEVTNLQTALDGKVNTTTTVNSKALSTNITINASDVPNTPAGNISATNVQNAINELDIEKANITQEAWITATLLNGATGSITYAKNSMGFVTVRVNITVNTSAFNTIQATLPTGYMPSVEAPIILRNFSVGGVSAQFTVDTSGNIRVLGGVSNGQGVRGMFTYYVGV